jgi:hypothetical protein
LPLRRPDGVTVAPLERGEIGPDLFCAACRMGLEAWSASTATGLIAAAGKYSFACQFRNIRREKAVGTADSSVYSLPRGERQAYFDGYQVNPDPRTMVRTRC